MFSDEDDYPWDDEDDDPDESNYPWDLEVDVIEPWECCPYCGCYPSEHHTDVCPLTDPPIAAYDA